jgi:hypothetical protein
MTGTYEFSTQPAISQFLSSVITHGVSSITTIAVVCWPAEEDI